MALMVEVEMSGGPLNRMRYCTEHIPRYAYLCYEGCKDINAYMRFQDGLVYYFDEGMTKALNSNREESLRDLEGKIVTIPARIPEGEENANPDAG